MLHANDAQANDAQANDAQANDAQVDTKSAVELSDVRLYANSSPCDFKFSAGEISVVLGGNKAGKTNLCRLIAGLTSDATGNVSIDGKPQNGLVPRRRPVAMVYQAFVNYPNLTVLENIASPVRGLGKQEANEYCEGLAELLGLQALLKRYPNELSGGQQQRLAIARALAKKAPVLLLDEPLVNLDFKLRESLAVELKALLKRTGTTVIYTSSDYRDAFAMADKLFLFRRGELLQHGAPMDVYQKPLSESAMALTADPQLNYLPGDALRVVRPEHVQIVNDEHSASHSFDMVVNGIETNGVSTYIYGDVQSLPWVVRCSGFESIEVGRTLSVSVRDNDVVAF